MNSILHNEFKVERDDYTHAGEAASKIKQILSRVGIAPAILRRIAVASYEAEINMIIHAYGGTITLDVFDDGIVKLVFQDPGPGIPNLEKALTPGYSTADEKARQMGFGAGMGLPNIKRVSDQFFIESDVSGTILTLMFEVS